MPLDGPTKHPPPQPGDPGNPTYPCLVIGGCANGTLLPAVDVLAQFIELKRPAYIKPLASAVQKVPEIANESDQYEVFPVGLVGETDEAPPQYMGIAVVRGRSMVWAFKQLVAAYAEKSVAELKAAGLSPPGTKSTKH